MSDRTPLAGLTAQQAAEAIERLAGKIAERKDSIKAAEAHLKAMRAARKNLADPEPVDAQNDGTVTQAQTAEVAAKAQEVGG